MPFSATAEGSMSAGTCSLTEDCQAGPNSAMPLPTTKQNTSRIVGVTMPSQASTVSAVAPVNATDSESSETMRRSYMSAMAPAGIAISMTGNIKAVCTSATLSADDVIWVMAQAAPTAWIRRPRLDNRLADQIRRNARYRSGAAMPSVGKMLRAGSVMTSFIPGWPLGAQMRAKALLVRWVAGSTRFTNAKYPRSRGRHNVQIARIPKAPSWRPDSIADMIRKADGVPPLRGLQGRST